MSEYRMYIAGEWVESESGAQFNIQNPATGERIGTAPEGTRTDAQHAINAATSASRLWASHTPFERGEAMERIATLMAERRETLARILTRDQGKPLKTEAYQEVDDCIEYWRMAAADAERIEGTIPPSIDRNKRVLLQRVPRGVVGAITPWNWPYEMPVEVIAPALASGNTVVWAPAPTTTACAVALAECIVDAGLPPGVFNMVTGPGPIVGDEIAHNPGTQTIAFVGSITTGHHVAQRAAGKELLLEMGGNGPLVILDDADIDAAVTATLAGCYLCAGQSCSASELILVHEDTHDRYVERLLEVIKQTVRLGDPFDPATTLGPLNNEPVARKMDEHVADALARGARLLLGGRRAPDMPTRLYYEPTVLDRVTLDMQVAREETFGPIVPIATISNEAEALEIVNSGEYGLLASIFSRDLGRALRWAEAVRTGWVNINESTNWWELHLPFGGRAGSRSGFGRVGGRHVYERLTEVKTIVIHMG